MKDLFRHALSMLILLAIVSGIFTIVGNLWEVGKAEKTPFLRRFLFWTGISALMFFNTSFKELPKKLLGFSLMLLWSSLGVVLTYLSVGGGFPENWGWAAFVVFLSMLGPLHRASDRFWKFVGRAFGRKRE